MLECQRLIVETSNVGLLEDQNKRSEECIFNKYIYFILYWGFVMFEVSAQYLNEIVIFRNTQQNIDHPTDCS